MKKERTTGDILKVVFVVIGALVSIGALVAVVYTVFKKYFQVTFECDGDCCDCDDCFADEEVYEPVCCCEDGAEDADEACCCEESAEEADAE